MKNKSNEKFCEVCPVRSGPRAKCFECGKRFCFDHIWGGQVCDGMNENDRIRDVCGLCKKELGYFHVGDREIKRRKK